MLAHHCHTFRADFRSNYFDTNKTSYNGQALRDRSINACSKQIHTSPIIFAGTPPMITLSGKELPTTEPLATTTFSPSITPLVIFTLLPKKTLLPTITFFET